MANPMNHGTIGGRISRDPQYFANNDGSRRLLVTIAADDNFKNREGERPTQFVQVEAFLPKDHDFGWGNVGKGDLIVVMYRVDASPFADKATGEVVYRTRLVVEGGPTYLEPKSVTDARRAKDAATPVAAKA